ncbi:fungal-specific transcription factor domain-containing protein [Neurospora intermedia]|uniref:Fungal-specific transcription factor domain-containing protein n=1 Tax=Neurospora intermedia TaxID=5142 RepID=A0ABR3CZK9_NEUIN
MPVQQPQLPLPDGPGPHAMGTATGTVPPSTASVASPPPGPAYKRASRKGATKRFACSYEDCNKVYSRAEHLQRHQLNHDPKEIYRCDFAGCEQQFVRADLLSRHRKRHSASYVPRNRVPSFSTPKDHHDLPTPGQSTSSQGQTPASSSSHQVAIESRSIFQGAPHDAAILLIPDSRSQQPQSQHQVLPSLQHLQSHHQQHQQQQGHHSHHQGSSAMDQHASPHWASPTSNISSAHALPPKNGFFQQNVTHGHIAGQQPPLLPYNPSVDFPSEDLARENFAVWLFNPQDYNCDLSVSHLPFLDGGLESALNNNIHYDYDSITSGHSQVDSTPTRVTESDSDFITEARLQELSSLFFAYNAKQLRCRPNSLRITEVVDKSGCGTMPVLNLDMTRDCLQEYWDHVSARLPIVHQPTFSYNKCSVYLLLVMIALGAASLRMRNCGDCYTHYDVVADIIVLGVRLDILGTEEAIPPIALWVAQALVLLEFYEKLYSSRLLHERAQTYHPVTLNLLRRGSPLIGRSGSESPPEPTGSADYNGNSTQSVTNLDSRTWWSRWAQTESMHRVVFAAFMLDITHAAMFGHKADMVPYEIQLPLPCDDNLWSASNPDNVRQLDQNLRMYGVKPVSFLEGLKLAIHGKEVMTHSFGRMIIMSGLLSVGWHLRRKETHNLMDLTKIPNSKSDSWKMTLLSAFDQWKAYFDKAQGSLGGSNMVDPIVPYAGSNGPIQSAAVLYHLAQFSLFADILDCQILAGAKRLLGKKISDQAYLKVVPKMKAWASMPGTRHAILHAYKVLHCILVDPRGNKGEQNWQNKGHGLPPMTMQPYSCRNEPDPHRPWIMYYAALSIWAFVRASTLTSPAPVSSIPSRSRKPEQVNFNRVAAYLSKVAALSELPESAASGLKDGLPELLDVLCSVLYEANSELLKEACERLTCCKNILTSEQ